MKKSTVAGVVVLMLGIFGALIATHKVHNPLRRAFGPKTEMAAFDGTWWDCSDEPTMTMCVHSLQGVRLNAAEQAFFDRLQTIPGPPAQPTEDELSAIIGQRPDHIIRAPLGANLIFRHAGPNGSHREVFIALFAGRVNAVVWSGDDGFKLMRGYSY